MAKRSGKKRTDWNSFVQAMAEQYAIKTRPAAAPETIAAAAHESDFETLDIVGLYSTINGLSLNRFQVFPLEDPNDVRHTKRGVRRANDSKSSEYLGGDEDLLKRFFVFADFGNGCCTAIDREDGSLWYEDAGEFHQTDLSTAEFIELCLKEASEQV